MTGFPARKVMESRFPCLGWYYNDFWLAFFPITETALINVKQRLRQDQWHQFFDQSDVLV
jgi:hypothetical protein